MTGKTYYNPINGETTTLLTTAEASGGTLTQFEVSLSPGGGNPLHYHKGFTEEFTAVKGKLGLRLGRKKLYLNPGETAIVPAYTHHRFYNDTDQTIVFRVNLTPAQPGFENFLKAMFGLVNDGRTVTKNQIPKNIYHTAIMYHWGDTHFSNPLAKVIAPLFGMLYKTAVKKGIEQQLLEKYCR